LFRLGQYTNADALLPYIDMIKLDRLRPTDNTAASLALLPEHIQRRPSDNPLPCMAARINADIEWLQAFDAEALNQCAFGVCPQCGASAELSATFLHWLAEHRPESAEDLEQAAVQLQALAESAKSLQFTLARAERIRNIDSGRDGDSMASGGRGAGCLRVLVR
jgi:hypothetical protein